MMEILVLPASDVSREVSRELEQTNLDFMHNIFVYTVLFHYKLLNDSYAVRTYTDEESAKKYVEGGNDALKHSRNNLCDETNGSYEYVKNELHGSFKNPTHH